MKRGSILFTNVEDYLYTYDMVGTGTLVIYNIKERYLATVKKTGEMLTRTNIHLENEHIFLQYARKVYINIINNNSPSVFEYNMGLS